MLARAFCLDNDPCGYLLESLEAESKSIGLRIDWFESAAMSEAAMDDELRGVRRRCEVVLGELDALSRPDLMLISGGRDS